MNTILDPNWPEVPREEFEAALTTQDYWCEAWANASVYIERASGRRFGYQLLKGRTFLHPELRRILGG